jgi:hypothetical protein
VIYLNMAAALLIVAFVVYSIRRGEISLRNRPVYRTSEPRRFWGAVVGFALIAALSLLIGAAHLI